MEYFFEHLEFLKQQFIPEIVRQLMECVYGSENYLEAIRIQQQCLTDDYNEFIQFDDDDDFDEDDKQDIIRERCLNSLIVHACSPEGDMIVMRRLGIGRALIQYHSGSSTWYVIDIIDERPNDHPLFEEFPIVEFKCEDVYSKGPFINEYNELAMDLE